MGTIRFGVGDEAVRRTVEEAMEKTVVHRRQTELAVGRWDFVVFGPDGATGAVARICVAEHARIRRAPVYLAALGGSGEGMTLGELTDDDCDPRLARLTVESLSPWRPIRVEGRRREKDVDRLREALLAEYAAGNMALVETPDDRVWGVSAFRYLAECDARFPDPVMDLVRGSPRNRLQ